jgi:hypothetical protein
MMSNTFNKTFKETKKEDKFNLADIDQNLMNLLDEIAKPSPKEKVFTKRKKKKGKNVLYNLLI